MKKFICQVYGYIYEGDEAPLVCPVCDAPYDEFVPMDGDKDN